ncbi:MAG: hypothetical protein SF029_15385 [bacterium]|nr:hypothetical protein [bacterium]
MLLRAYRLSDRFGLVILKSVTGVTGLLLDGAHLLLGTGGGVLGRGIGVIVGVFAAIFGLLWGILRFIGGILGRLLALIFGLFGVATTRGTRAGARAGSKAARSAQGVLNDSMARRAAREEMVDVAIAEDPLRAQNRALSALVVVALAGLVAVVIWATSRPSETPMAVASLGEEGLNLSVGPTAAPTLPNEVLLASPVPTATILPSVLQVRGSLAFTARERAQQDIWVVSVGGAAPLRLTNSPGDERDPAWSPDGQRLAFASNWDYAANRRGNWEVYITDISGGEPQRMTYDLSFQAGPVWSPDGLLLAYESYQGNNLDIYIMSLDGSITPRPLPSLSAAPEFSPAWSPEGRRIAYTSWQDGNQEIYVFSLDTLEATNLTNTPDRHEDYAAWSPDGNLVAYSAVDAGIEKVFIKPADQPQTPAQVFRRGRMPSWSPDGNSLVFAVDSLEGTQFIVEPYNSEGVATPITAVPLPAAAPVWAAAPLPASLVNSGGLPLGIDEPLYDEFVFEPDGDPPYVLQALSNVTGPEVAYLSERVNDAYDALRERVNAEAGLDFLGQLEAAMVDINARPQPGEDVQTWLKTGRAFAFNRNLILGGFPVPVELVREDTDLQTYWRVYVRVSEDAQSGQLGEPLRRAPWQFVTSAQGDVEAYDAGGRLQPQIPAGYYIDLTQLAEDYGWQRMPAGQGWRANAGARNYWLFYKPDSLTWYAAMRELYPEGQLVNFRPANTPAPATLIPTTTPGGQ